jgi:hypothetical protein
MAYYDLKFVGAQIDALLANGGSPSGVYANVAALEAAYPSGDTHLYLVTADNNWYYWSGSAWTAGGAYLTSTADQVTITDAGGYYSSGYVEGALQEAGSKLSGIEAGAEVNNISDANATDLTDSGDTALHYHAADRSRANHTGTQTAATISDFDTEVSNNSDVTANTAARHDAVTLGTANGLSLSSQELSLDTATASTAGAMSADDKINLADTQVKTARNADSISDLQTVVQSLNPNNADKITQTMYGTAASLPITAGGGGLGAVIGGATWTNLVSGEDIPNGNSVSWDSANGNHYYDSLNAAILSGDGTTMNATNSSGATADMMIIDLGGSSAWSYGLTAAQMLNLCPAYFDGTKNVGPQRVTATGKNVFDKNASYVEYSATVANILATGIKVKSNSSGINQAVSYTLLLNPNTTYTLHITVSVITGGSLVIIKDALSGAQLAWKNTSGSVTFAAPSHGKILAYFYSTYGVTAIGEVDYTEIQLESGDTATAHEDYTDTKAYYPAIGNSVPSGIADGVNNLTDEKARKVQEYTLVASDIVSLSTTGIYVNIVTTKVFSDYIGGTDGAKDSNYILDGYPELEGNDYNWDNTDNIGKSYARSDKAFRIVVDKSTYADLAAAQADLAGTEIWYQLAEPVITGNVVSGALVSHSKGSVYITPAVSGAEIYSGGISILNTNYPIDTLESIYKVDPTTGALTAIDVSTAVIASGGLSFTHPDLTNGDLVEYVYLYDEALTVYGVTNLEYYYSRTTTTDTVNGKHYRWEIISTNGVPSIAQTEVH